MRKSFFLFILLPFFIFGQAKAEEIPVNVVADTLKYSEDSSLVTASGSVEIKVEDVTIRADNLVIDTSTNIMTAEGRVQMITKDYDSFASRATYNASTEYSSFVSFETAVLPARVQSKLFLRAKKIDDYAGQRMEGEEGAVTSCEYAQPHYYTLGSKVEFFPNEKIVGHNVTMFVGKLPVLWTPYLYYDLKEKDKRNWIFGHNEVEGDFVKSTWDWPYGLLYLDWMDKKGVGYGLSRDYVLGALGFGSFFVYHLSEKDTHLEDWVTKINQRVVLDSATKLDFAHTSSSIYQIPSGRTDSTTFHLSLDHSAAAKFNWSLDTLDDRMGKTERYTFRTSNSYNNGSTSYYYNVDQGKDNPRWMRIAQRFTHSQPLFVPELTSSTYINYFDNISAVGGSGDEQMEPQTELKYVHPWYTATLTENWYLDLDQNLYLGDENNQYLEKQPELNVAFKPVETPLFNLSPQFGYGWYHEVKYVGELGRNRDFGTSRYQMSLNADKTIPLKFGTSLVLGAGVDQFLYDPGDQLYAMRENAGLHTELGSFFRNTIDWKRGLTQGNTPFFFDRLDTRYNNIKDRITFYHQNKFNWWVETGYNYETEEYFDALTEMLISPADSFNLRWRTGWDIEEQKYIDLITGLKLKPISWFCADLNMVNDLNLGGLKSANSLLDFIIWEGSPNSWQVKMSHVYNTTVRDFVPQDIMVQKNLHCWDIKFAYSNYRKEVTFTFSLKALPDQPIGYTTGRGFYFEGFDKGLNELNQESIRRY